MNAARFTEAFHNHTFLHPLGIAFIVCCGSFLIVLPRKYALWPLFLLACFVAPAQRIVVLSLDFNFLRILVLIGWLRIVCRGEIIGYRFVKLDGIVVAWAIVSTITYTASRGSLDAFVYRTGTAFDALGFYFLFRCLIRNIGDVECAMRGLAMIAIPLAAFFVVEKLTGRNVFSVFGGVPEFTSIRQGTLRAQGAFSHEIIAGAFWASLVPMIAILWWQRKGGKLLASAGIAAALVIVVATASSTPLAAVIAATFGIALYPLRQSMRWVRWTAVAAVIGLHLIMNAPVWHLLSRIDLVGGSTGWHRFKLIDLAIKHFDEWWLIGVADIGHWGIRDITNEYILQGLQGGLATLGLLLAMIFTAFSYLGQSIRKSAEETSMWLWLVGVSLFVHCVIFMGVSYFGQIIVIWYFTLAVIGSLFARMNYQVVAYRGSHQATLVGVTCPARREERLV